MKNLINIIAILIVNTFINSTSLSATPTTVVIGMQLEPPNLNPTSGAAAAIDEIVYSNLFEGLTKYNSDGAIVPSLARSWDISSDGKTYIFNLNSNIFFHDGTKMDASDIKFSFDRARGETSTNAQKILFKDIEKVEVLNSTTVRVNLSSPNGSFLTNLAWGDAVIISEESVQQAETFPIGTGPFKFHKWVKGDRIELVRNTSYWGKKIYLDKATFKFISDPTAAYAALMTGDIDAFPVFPGPENLIQFSNNSNFNVMVGTTEGETLLSINNKVAPFDKLEMRKAVAHAINRQEIIDGAMFGYGTPIGTHFAPHHPDYLNLTSNSKYDPNLSRKLIFDSGYDEGVNVNLKLPPPSYARRSGEIIASQLRKVGINVKIINLEWAQWLRQVFKDKDYNLTIVSHTEPYDINIYGRNDYYFQYDSDAFKLLMRKLDNETNIKERTLILHQAQELISLDYVNGYLFQLAKTGVANSKLRGLWKNSPTQANDLTEVKWSE